MCVAVIVPWLVVVPLVGDEPSPQSIVYDHGPSLSGSLNVAVSVYIKPTSIVSSGPALTVGGRLTVTVFVFELDPPASVTVRVTL